MVWVLPETHLFTVACQRHGSDTDFRNYTPSIMAKKRPKRSFDFDTISSKEATERRSVRGTRRSKYSPIGDQFKELDKDKTLVFTATKNEVQGVRNYMRRNFEGAHQVNSRRADGEDYEVHISKS